MFPPAPVKDVMAFGDCTGDLPFPIIADHKRELSVQLGMLDPDELDKEGMPLTARCVRRLSHINLCDPHIGKKLKIKIKMRCKLDGCWIGNTHSGDCETLWS